MFLCNELSLLVIALINVIVHKCNLDSSKPVKNPLNSFYFFVVPE